MAQRRQIHALRSVEYHSDGTLFFAEYRNHLNVLFWEFPQRHTQITDERARVLHPVACVLTSSSLIPTSVAYIAVSVKDVARLDTRARRDDPLPPRLHRE